MGECVCDMSGFCSVRNIELKPTLQSICRVDKARVDAFLASEGKPPEQKQTLQSRRRSCGPGPRGQCTECSDLGTMLTAAIETDTGQRISCGSCRNYLAGLNRVSVHDAAAIIQTLYAEISWPPHWRSCHGDKDNQRKRIGEIVATAMKSATTTCQVRKPRRPRMPSASSRRNSEIHLPLSPFSISAHISGRSSDAGRLTLTLGTSSPAKSLVNASLGSPSVPTVEHHRHQKSSQDCLIGSRYLLFQIQRKVRTPRSCN